MNTLTGALKNTTDSVGDMVQGVGKGVGDAVQGVGRGAGDVVEGVGRGVGGGGKEKKQKHEHNTKDVSPPPQDGGEKVPDASHGGGLLGGITGAIDTLNTTITSTASSGTSLLQSAASSGLKIGGDIAKAGLDTTQNVAVGSANLAGTALGGVIDAAADASGAIFAPVGAGLAALGGLEKLGESGLEKVNGLSLGAVREVSALTSRAMNMSGKTPTFFDPDADGVVGMQDTTRGLVLLGLDEKTAGYAAYALHSIFAYPTSESWIPNTTTIHVARMGRTRWGRNWGSFERLEWVDDVDVNDFFAPKKDEKQWADYWKQGRQYFGILLLIFEWGTTWPFYIPPVPVQEIPFSNEIGNVVRKAILPTILSNFQKARAKDPEAKGKPRSKKPSEHPPTDPKDA